MTTLTLTDNQSKRITSAPSADTVLPTRRVVHNVQEQIDIWRDEIDDYFLQMKSFGTNELSEVMREIAAMTARLSEIRSQIMRANNRTMHTFRTQEVDPFLDEAHAQFKIHSRRATLLFHEYEQMAKVE